MKNKGDVCVILQARLSSERVPKKMIKPFAESSLFEIGCRKLKESNIIPKENIYVSVYEQELIDIAKKCNMNIFKRSKKSALFDGDGHLTDMFEWWNKLPYKYVIIVSACLPLLKIETIENFYKEYLSVDKNGMSAVMKKKTYYWDENKKLITKKFEKSGNMNTKVVETTYEAANCLYAGKMKLIGDGIWMGDFTKNEIELFSIDEKECFDIDYNWQFEIGEVLYEKFKNRGEI
jgi:CMP-N-acetylneuraminic acid synthetase